MGKIRKGDVLSFPLLDGSLVRNDGMIRLGVAGWWVKGRLWRGCPRRRGLIIAGTNARGRRRKLGERTGESTTQSAQKPGIGGRRVNGGRMDATSTRALRIDVNGIVRYLSIFG